MKKSRDVLAMELRNLQEAFNRLVASMMVIVKEHGETEVRDEDARSIPDTHTLSIVRDNERKTTRYTTTARRGGADKES